MQLYYITDRCQFPGPESRRRERLLSKIAEAAMAGVDYIQLREKDLPAREMESLAREAVRLCHKTRDRKRETRLLINSRIDVALAAGADGVHLTSTDMPAADARAVWSSVMARNAKGEVRNGVFGVSCHTTEQVRLAEAHGADFSVFGPVFEKQGTSLTVGLGALRAACSRAQPAAPNTESVPFGYMPLLAIGGVTLENARACLDAGAAGLAAIRLFQENDIAGAVQQLRRVER